MSSGKKIVLVLGVHRGGTSMIAGLCGTFGYALPAADLMAADQWNPLGYFESLAIAAAHDKLLLALGRRWHDLRPLPDAWLDSSAAKQCVSELTALLAKAPPAERGYVIKDPRCALLIPLWQRVAQDAGFELAAACVMRRPGEVARSLDRRDLMNPLIGTALWWRYTTAIVADARSLPNVLLTYEEVLSDPRRLYDAMGKSLALPLEPWTDALAVEVAKRAVPDLRRNTETPADLQGRPMLAAAEALYRDLEAVKTITHDVPVPSRNPHLDRIVEWFPEWQRLFVKHLQFRERAKAARSLLDGALSST